jgi:hypothetical protein
VCGFIAGACIFHHVMLIIFSAIGKKENTNPLNEDNELTKLKEKHKNCGDKIIQPWETGDLL